MCPSLGDTLHNLISWTEKLPAEGVKRETRVHVSHRHLKWQFKRTDQEKWDYDSSPTPADWDRLEDVLSRRAGRGISMDLLAAVRALRTKARQ
jgi:hypothetical protein